MKWFGLLAAALAGQAQAGESCDALKLDRLPVCVEASGGVVLAPDEAQARDISASIEAARPRFETLFGHPAPAYAVIFDSPTHDEIATLERAGYPAVLPWMDSAQLIAQFEQKMRDAISAKIPGMSQEQLDRIVAEKLAELRANLGGASAAAHEMGHLWFTQVFWASYREGDAPAGHYGSPAPDWLDEISGLAFEDETMAGNRRLRFRELWSAGQGIVPLPQFLAMTHPENGKADKGPPPPPPGDGGGGTVTVRADVSERSLATSAFYAQGRVFADFLIANGKPGVLGAISAAVSDGIGFDQWLADQGAAHGLPGDIAGLETRWKEWTVAAYGDPG
ncbi:MAG: hypothetical protein QM698_17100 [Micropepsaceae bacterium]